MSQKSTQVALGGVFSALCLMLMFMTGMIPFASYLLPSVAGAMLVAVVVENGRKTAVLVYISVSILSLFVVPDREASMMFIVFFGYYPIIKEPLERIPIRGVQLLVKLLIFNGSIIGGFLFLISVLGLAELVGTMGTFGRYTAVILLGVGNLIFLMYDFVLTRYTQLYKNWFKPRFLRR